MSDFRVIFQTAPLSKSDSTQKELDWEEKEQRWFLSEKQQYEVSWLEHIIPEPDDLEELILFFDLDKARVNVKDLAFLNPGALVRIHQENNSSPTLYAYMCDKCQLHWYVFKFDRMKNEWLIYGRSCDFSWKRGNVLDSEEKVTLDRMRK